MSIVLYSPVANDALTALAEAGAEFNAYRLTSVHDPILGSSLFEATKVAVTALSVRPGRPSLDEGESGVRGDVKRLLVGAPGLAVQLAIGDLVRWPSGIYYAITEIEPISPDGTNVVVYYVNLKRQALLPEQHAAISYADVP